MFVNYTTWKKFHEIWTVYQPFYKDLSFNNNTRTVAILTGMDWGMSNLYIYSGVWDGVRFMWIVGPATFL